MKPRFDQGLPHYLSFFQTINLNSQNNYSLGASIGRPVSSTAIGTGTIYATPVFFGRAFRLKQYGIMITTVGTSGRNLAIGLYNDTLEMYSATPYANGFNYPGKKLDQATFTSISTTGFKSKTFDPPLYLKGNRLYWAVIHSDTTGALNASYLENTIQLMGFQPDSALAYTFKGFSKALTYTGTLPDPFTDAADDLRYPFAFFFRELNQSGS